MTMYSNRQMQDMVTQHVRCKGGFAGGSGKCAGFQNQQTAKSGSGHAGWPEQQGFSPQVSILHGSCSRYLGLPCRDDLSAPFGLRPEGVHYLS